MIFEFQKEILMFYCSYGFSREKMGDFSTTVPIICIAVTDKEKDSKDAGNSDDEV